MFFCRWGTAPVRAALTSTFTVKGARENNFGATTVVANGGPVDVTGWTGALTNPRHPGNLAGSDRRRQEHGHAQARVVQRRWRATLTITGLAPGRASLRIANTSRWLGIRVRKADDSLPDYCAVAPPPRPR